MLDCLLIEVSFVERLLQWNLSITDTLVQVFFVRYMEVSFTGEFHL